MAKKSMDDLLKRRMSAAQQASELEVGNEAYWPMRNVRDWRKSRLSGAIKSFVPSPVCGMSFHEKRNASRLPGCIWL